MLEKVLNKSNTSIILITILDFTQPSLFFLLHHILLSWVFLFGRLMSYGLYSLQVVFSEISGYFELMVDLVLHLLHLHLLQSILLVSLLFHSLVVFRQLWLQFFNLCFSSLFSMRMVSFQLLLQIVVIYFILGGLSMLDLDAFDSYWRSIYL